MGRPRVNHVAIGARYGTRVVLQAAAGRRNNPRWLCRCDCGREHLLTAYEINRRGTCKVCSNESRRCADSPLRRVLRDVKARARDAGRPWRLSDALAIDLMSSPCHYCGTPPSNVTRGFRYTGIDRVNNERGYVANNVAPCCRTCNWAKGTKSYADFVAWLDRLVAFRGNR